MRANAHPIRLFSLALALTGSVVLVGCSSGESTEQIVAAAQAYLAQGKAAEAEIELKRALERDAGAAAPRVLLGRLLLLQKNDPAAAEVELRRALELGAAPDDVVPLLARAQLVLGKAPKVIEVYAGTALARPAAQAELRSIVASAYAQQGQAERARATIQDALLADPKSSVAVVVQARMKASEGDIDGALKLLADLLATDPGNADAGTARGYLLLLGRNDLDGALAAQRQVLAAHPKHVPALAEVVTILMRQQKVQPAREAFRTLQAVAPTHPETVFFQAQFAFVDGQYGRSRELIDELLKVVADHPRALELAAAAEYRLGHEVQAQAYAARALKVLPSLVLARQLLAQSQLRMGNTQQALQALEPLLQGPSPDAGSVALAAEVAVRMGDLRRADELFKRVATLAPQDKPARTRAAVAMLDAGRTDIATRELEALAAGDAQPRADLALFSARVAGGDFAGALKVLDALQRKMPDRPLPDQLRGQVQIAQRDAAAARRSFEAALAKDAKYFPAVAALSSMEVAAGHADAARQRVKAFLKNQPGHGQATILLSSIPGPDGAPAPDAAAILAEGVRANPRDVALHLALIQRHRHNGDRAAALNAAQAAGSALPNELAIQQALGQAQLAAGLAQQAVSTLGGVAARQDRNALAQVNLAQALIAAMDLDAAQAALKKALEFEPRLDSARRSLAMLALQRNQPEQALAIARELQQHDPKSGYGEVVEGDIQAQRRNWSAAALAYRKALDASGASEAAIKLHTAYRALGRTADAERLAAEWEGKRPKDPAFRFYLGDQATNQGDFAGAQAHYRTVLAAQPGNALAMNNIAWLLHKQHQGGALAMAERANALLPNRAPLLDTLASIQAAAGDIGKAVQTQQAAVGAEPADANLKLNLARYQIEAGQRSDARQTLQALAALGSAYPRQAEVQELLKKL